MDKKNVNKLIKVVVLIGALVWIVKVWIEYEAFLTEIGDDLSEEELEEWVGDLE